MPHVVVKLFPGQPEALKKRLCDAIAQNVVDVLGCKESVVSVSFEEVDQSDWAEKVYRPEIAGKPDKVYKKPGYVM